MAADASLVRAWEDPGGYDGLAWRDREMEGVLIGGGRVTPTFVSLRRSAAGDPPRGDRHHVPGASAVNRTGRDVPPTVDEHLVAGPGENSWPWLSCADVIVRRIDEPTPDDPLGSYLARLPGCLVVVGNTQGRGFLVAVRGRRARLTPMGGGACTDEQALSYASALHLWIVSGRPLDALSMARLTAVRGRATVRPGVLVTVRESQEAGDGRPVPEREAVRRAAR
ncbi:hypothetical protein [Actinomadura sp. 9N215]|uniref:hypothetical protein n=1 Tax=Actinomadura sp. 9N215 TaxID=3375150 RepID=UPI0037AF1B5D